MYCDNRGEYNHFSWNKDKYHIKYSSKFSKHHNIFLVEIIFTLLSLALLILYYLSSLSTRVLCQVIWHEPSHKSNIASGSPQDWGVVFSIEFYHEIFPLILLKRYQEGLLYFNILRSLHWVQQFNAYLIISTWPTYSIATLYGYLNIGP